MTGKRKTRIRLNTEEPELLATHPPVQTKKKTGDTEPFYSNSFYSQAKPIQPKHRMMPSGQVRARVKIGEPNDSYEQEADRVAGQVIGTETGDGKQTSRSITPLVQRRAMPQEDEPGAPDHMEPDEIQEDDSNPELETAVQTKAVNPAPQRLDETQLAASRSGGTPIPGETREFMETRFGTGFGHVRIHDDSEAHRMNRQLQSRAFAHGEHIYFGQGEFNPHTMAGKHLLAHELTHVLQQGPARNSQSTSVESKPIQRSTSNTPSADGGAWNILSGLLSSITGLITRGREAAAQSLRELLERIPGYKLLGVILGKDPITDAPVERNGRNFIEAGLDVIPFGSLFKEKLEREGAMDEAAAWLDEQIGRLDFSPTQIIEELREFWQNLSGLDVFRPMTVIGRLQNIFQPRIWRLFRFARDVALKLLEIVKEFLIQQLIDFIRERTNAYPLVRVILGHDPISGEEVPRNGMNLIRGFMELSDDGEQQLSQMEQTGTLQRAAQWIDGAIERLTRNVESIITGFSRIWNSVSIENLMDPVGTFSEIYNTFAGPVGDIMDFLVEMAITVLKYIKDALLSRLSAYARSMRGYPLLTVIINKDPFTGEHVPRTAHNFIRGFLSLLEDGEQRYNDLQRSGAIDRAFAWLNNEVQRLDLSWEMILQLFRTTWEELSIHDLANPTAAFQRVVNRFRAPVARLIRFAGAVAMKILEFVFEGVMGSGGARVLNILKQARDTFMTIVNDPVRFIRNLIAAVVRGFRQFKDNILTHLRAGLVGWLFGAMEGAGIELPQHFDLRGIISLVLQILGLTYPRIRRKMVRLMGERAVSTLERTFEFVRMLATEGPAGAWQRIVEYAGNLRERVMEGIRNWVITRVVTAAVMRLATMWNPAGAVVQAIIGIYNTVMFFIERINQIMALVRSVTSSVASIAAGNITAASNYVEQSMARTLPLIISFLARLLGLGNISGAIRRNIQRIRRPIDRAIDRVIAWIRRQARRLIRGARRGARRIRSRVRRGVRRVIQWWRMRKRFRTQQGERHTLFFRGRGRNSRLLMASTTARPIREIINDVRDASEKRSLNQGYERMMTIAGQIDRNPNDQGLQTQMRGALDGLAERLARLIGPSNKDLPATNVTYQKRDRPFLVLADPLTEKVGNTVGSVANRRITDGYTWIDRWVKDGWECPSTHLLAEDRLKGPGDADWNVVFSHQKLNAGMRDGPEKEAKNFIKSHKKIRYTSRTNSFFSNSPPPGGLDPNKVKPNLKEKYVGYYICKSISVKIDLWENDAYQNKYDKIIKYETRPKFTKESRESDEKKIRNAIKKSTDEEKESLNRNGVGFLHFKAPRLYQIWVNIRRKLMGKGLIVEVQEPSKGGAINRKLYIKESYIINDMDILNEDD